MRRWLNEQIVEVHHWEFEGKWESSTHSRPDVEFLDLEFFVSYSSNILHKLPL